MPDPLEDATANMVFGYVIEQLALDGRPPSYIEEHRDLIIRCILGTLDALNIPIAGAALRRLGGHANREIIELVPASVLTRPYRAVVNRNGDTLSARCPGVRVYRR